MGSDKDSVLARAPYGLTAIRVRGILVLTLLLATVYFAIFESNPPPVFTEVEIVIPPKPPMERFDEKNIVLPEFDTSPLEGGGKVVKKVQAKKESAKPAPAAQPGSGKSQAPKAAKQSSKASEKASPAKAQAKASEQGFVVQVAALKQEGEARELADSVAELLRENTFVEEVENSNSKLWRVRVGPFGDDRGKAREVLNRLQSSAPKLGENAFVDER